MKVKFLLSLILAIFCITAAHAAPPDICLGDTTVRPACSDSLLTLYPGGTWTSSNATVIYVNPETGEITALSTGSATISYTVTSGCGTFTFSYTLSVSVASVSGTAYVCTGSTTTLTGSPGGGTWSSSNPTIATVGSSSGIVGGISAGTTTITYTSAAGCKATKIITVNAPPDVSMCQIQPVESCDSVATWCGQLAFRVTGAPSGATITWHRAGATGATPTQSMADGNTIFTFTTAPSAGVHTMSVTYAGCTTTRTVRILVYTDSCSPCNGFRTPCTSCEEPLPFKTISAATLTSGNVSASAAGYYHITAPNVSLQVSPAPGSVFFISGRTQFTVPTGTNVTLDSVHMFSDRSCMWKGIEVANTSTGTGQLTLTRSFIEHVQTGSAYTKGGAVSVHSNFSYEQTFTSSEESLPSSGYVIDARSTTFNMNNVAIGIRDFNAVAGVPVQIKNIVATSRNFCSYKLPGATDCYAYYPYSWPTTSYLKKVDAGGYYPRYRIDSFPVQRSLENGLPAFGVLAYYAGRTDGSGNTTYLITGDSASYDNANLFDTLGISFDGGGIKAMYTNLKSFGSICRGGYHGIRVEGNSSENINVNVKNGAHDTINNRLYNCTEAIYATNLYKFWFSGILFSSNSTNANMISARGIHTLNNNITVSQGDIEKNTIQNIEDGLRIIGSGSTVCFGNVRIIGNTISGLSGPSGTEISRRGMFLQHEGSCQAGSLTVKNNTITGHSVFGIQVVNRAYTIIDSNTIILRNRTVGPSGNIKGIWVSRGSSNAVSQRKAASICYNHVYGDTTANINYKSPTITVNTPNLGDLITSIGIQIERAGNADSLTALKCNYVHDMGIGFVFLDTSHVQWRNNVIARTTYGMSLEKQRYPGIGDPYRLPTIGTQGSYCTPSDNVWDNSSSGWPGWGATYGGRTISHTHMENVNADSAQSNLFVRSGAPYQPTVNSQTGGVAYATANGTIIIDTCSSAGTAAQCAPVYYSSGSMSRSAAGTSNIPVATIAAYSIFPNPGDGNFTIQHSDGFSGQVKSEVMNVAGQVVSSIILRFTDGNASFQMGNKAPGLYLIRITNQYGNISTLRFVLQ